MFTDLSLFSRKELFTRRDGLLRQYNHEQTLAREWGNVCHASAVLARVLVDKDKETTRWLIDLSANAGKKSALANRTAKEVDSLLSLLNRTIALGDATMTRQDLREEADARAEGGSGV